MSRAYSPDLRVRVLDATAGGMPARQEATRFGVGAATAIVWVRRAQEDGAPPGQPKGIQLDQDADFLLGLIAVRSIIALREMQRRLDDERRLSAGIGTLWRLFAARAITFKKGRARHSSAATLA